MPTRETPQAGTSASPCRFTRASVCSSRARRRRSALAAEGALATSSTSPRRTIGPPTALIATAAKQGPGP
ncbi:hypothetical protein [Kitasatospora sp. NPDC048407]|uniref:hypothetical protein n=1 Tax=Kitasatospora sp. NPDC048407 TaxID=3364051 RepID=UPI003722C0A2